MSLRFEADLDRPEATIAVVVDGADLAPETIEEIHVLPVVVEIRGDRMGYPEFTVPERARMFGRLPSIFTVRLVGECGEWEGSEANRFRLFDRHIHRFDAVDAELASPLLPDVVALAKEHREPKAVIGSYHDRVRTPDLPLLEDKLAQARDAGVDYVKIAMNLPTLHDLQLLNRFTDIHAHERVITVGMGKYGPASRLALPWAGSRLTYGHSGKAVVDGQSHFRDLHQSHLIDPAYAKLTDAKRAAHV